MQYTALSAVALENSIPENVFYLRQTEIASEKKPILCIMITEYLRVWWKLGQLNKYICNSDLFGKFDIEALCRNYKS